MQSVHADLRERGVLGRQNTAERGRRVRAQHVGGGAAAALWGITPPGGASPADVGHPEGSGSPGELPGLCLPEAGAGRAGVTLSPC